ncbi:thiol-disulfide oxidoreductase DCC family protein [Fluviispira multicolorata]|uniref:DUF393 domain-containing protein n=1 Tax=Fluviispira multicolorata TaxID=2654512 RepID=A0A833N342_9BACT|nr:DUF393 domain-containing protein [Fluviispira multicolorata]
MKKILVFIDGDCLFCSKFSLLCLKLEKNKEYNFYFCDLNAEISKIFFKKNHYTSDNKSIVLYKNENVYIKFFAIIELSKHLKFPLNLFILFKFIPSIFHNKIYDIFSKNRYLFGKSESCEIIPQEYKKRFITRENDLYNF